MPNKVAFALAGLGGLNAHGMGFLEAATVAGLRPDLVTATSGQIVVLADWLADPSMKKTKAELFGAPPLTPAYLQAVRRWWMPPFWTEQPFDVLADRLWPAQALTPHRTQEDYEAIAAAFNAEQTIGVVFNAYDYGSGKGVLYGNDAARTLWPAGKKLEEAAPSADARISPPDGGEDALRKIDADAVKAALWLSLYGFDGAPGGLVDGAYHRSCIVSELHGFERVFAVRPLARGWIESGAPSNWFEVKDWETEMWFSASYKAETAGMARINDLIEAGRLTDDKYRYVDLVEVAAPTPSGYFNYFGERPTVFQDALKVATDKIAEAAARDKKAAARPG